MNKEAHVKRREFLSKLMRYGLSTGALSALPVERLFAQELLPTLAIPIIDAHAHLPSDVSPEEHTFMAIRSAKLSATSIAVMGDKDSVVGADLAFAYALEGNQIVRGWEAAGLVKIVRQPRDIPLKSEPTGPIHVILAIEGGDATRITTRDAGGRRRLYDEMASIVETGEWENISDIGLLTDAMRAGGLGTLEISAFMGLNLLRVFTRCHAARPILNYFY